MGENLTEKERESRTKDLTKKQSYAILASIIPKWEDLIEEQRKKL